MPPLFNSLTKRYGATDRTADCTYWHQKKKKASQRKPFAHGHQYSVIHWCCQLASQNRSTWVW